MIDPPFQDVGRLRRDPQVRVTETADIGTQYLGFDQFHDELPGSGLKGHRNPFKDLRVRQAVAHAIDTDAIVAKVCADKARRPDRACRSSSTATTRRSTKRLRSGEGLALLKDAGYADRFSTGLDCVAITWRAAACQAIAGMLAQVGVRVTFTPSPAAQFFPKITQAQTPFFEFGWTPTTDAWTMLNPTIHTFDPAGGGTFNGGRYSNPRLDAAIDAVRVAPTLDARRALVRDALAILAADLPLLPLYRRTLAWAMRPDIEVAMWPNDILELRFVRVKPP